MPSDLSYRFLSLSQSLFLSESVKESPYVGLARLVRRHMWGFSVPPEDALPLAPSTALP